MLIRLGHFTDRQMSGGRGWELDNGLPAGKLGQTIDMRTYSGGIVVLGQFCVLRLNAVILTVQISCNTVK